MNIQTDDIDEIGTDTFGKAVAVRLTEGAEDLPHEITERLKAARVMAMSKRRVAASDANQLATDAPHQRSTLLPKIPVAHGALNTPDFRSQTLLSKP